MATVPPPSPIPTGKGSRSAANPALSQHLATRPVEIPELSLPEYIQPQRSVPPDIDLGSLVNRETNAVNRVLKSATVLGVIRITGHGVPVHEVRTQLTESWFTGSEELVWKPLRKGAVEPAWEIIKREKWRSFRQKMENIRNELERVASELVQVLYENSNDRLSHGRIKRIDPALNIQKFNFNLLVGGVTSISSGENYETRKDYALNLHLPLEQCEFQVQSKQGTLSFSANQHTILVTIGKELEVWSQGEFKSAYGEVIFDGSLINERSSYFIDLKCSSSVSTLDECKNNKTISITDQIVLMIAIPILYKMCLFMFY